MIEKYDEVLQQSFKIQNVTLKDLPETIQIHVGNYSVPIG